MSHDDANDDAARPAMERPVAAGPLVLVVDDDPLQRKLAEWLLIRAGFSVEALSTAEEALRRVSIAPPAAILSDMRMPGMDGFELCRELRRDVRLRRIPIVLASSASADELDEGFARELGAAACVPRTDDFREIIDALRMALAQSSVDASD